MAETACIHIGMAGMAYKTARAGASSLSLGRQRAMRSDLILSPNAHSVQFLICNVFMTDPFRIERKPKQAADTYTCAHACIR